LMAKRIFNRWEVPPYLMSPTLEGGMISSSVAEDDYHPRRLITRGRFLLLAAKEHPVIALDLFQRTSATFNALIAHKKLYRILWGEHLDNLHFVVDELFDEQASDEEVSIRIPLWNAVDDWVKEWFKEESDNKPLSLFACAALIGGTFKLPTARSSSDQEYESGSGPAPLSLPPLPPPGQSGLNRLPVVGWERAAKDLLRYAHMRYLLPNPTDLTGVYK